MLKVLRFGENYSELCALLLGGFDGLHLGHRVLLQKAKKTGLPVGITTLAGVKKGGDMFTLSEREFIFERAGLDFVVELDFNDDIKNTSAEDFIKKIFATIPAQEAFCGEDFRFGKNAQGTPELLKQLAPCPVCVMNIVKSDYMRAYEEHAGVRKISASACKKHLADGDVHLLNECLFASMYDFFDCAYFMQGVVEHGRQVGRTYGFPTLNLSLSAEKLPPKEGVYGGFAVTPKGRFPSIINVGSRPTFSVEERKVEAYLDGFSGDLYGEIVRIYPTEFFRRIQKFASADELKGQLERDIRRLREANVNDQVRTER